MIFSFFLFLFPIISKPPNVVFFLADDLGYNEVGYGNPDLFTPNIDELKDEGLELANYYVLPLCSSSRSALMTGRYSIRSGTHSNTIHWNVPWGISTDEPFISEYFKKAGYNTALFGKWHLGHHKDEVTPWGRGFDAYEGFLQGCQSVYTHVSDCCEHRPNTGPEESFICSSRAPKWDTRSYDWWKNNEPDFSANHIKSTHLITRAAEEFIEKHQMEEDKPFFLYMSYQNVHSPITTDNQYKDMYANNTELNDLWKRLYGYVTEMDDSIGTIVKHLRDTHQYENTIIIFSSDNGAPSLKRWSRGRPDHGRNHPWRGHKSQVWEGGTRVRGLIHSTLLPKERRGQQLDTLFHITDWLPTLLHACGINLRSSITIDGVSQWEQILGANTSTARTDMLYNINPICKDSEYGAKFGTQAHEPNAAIRRNGYKLVYNCYDVAGIGEITTTGGRIPDKKGPWLFNIIDDPKETTNIIDEHPEIVQELDDLLRSYADQMVHPMIFEPPWQGEDYYCADCPPHPQIGPYEALGPWVDELFD